MPEGYAVGLPVLWEEPAHAVERKLVIWLPGFTGANEEMRGYLRELAAAGYVALSFDPVDHGERSRFGADEAVDHADGGFRDPASGKIYRHFWAIVAETAAEVPALIDWAVATLGVAPAVGIGGISMGGNIAIAAAAHDRRIVAVATGLAEADWLRPGSTIPLSAPNAYIQSCYERFDPLANLARYRHCPALLLQCGADDQLIPSGGARRFVQALGPTYADCPERLRIEIEEGVAHEFTPTMWRNVLRWIGQYL